MALSLVRYPDPILSTPCVPVAVDDAIRRLAENMLELMYEHEGVGLAAPQIGSFARLFVMDTSSYKDDPVVLINPTIVEIRGSVISAEGCLSFPGIELEVVRAPFVKVKAFDKYGSEIEYEATGLGARCIQHEIDHLDGVTFLDRLSRMKRQMVEKKIQKGKPYKDR